MIAHAADLGMMFYTGKMFPKKYQMRYLVLNTVLGTQLNQEVLELWSLI
ncbi:MAG: hypothetical protein CM1200mP13_09430 [Candidatus Pelagibacterales bacterium]|nr:MAG: hypothetical protein CM1200mP13_09430 [Pelagibacterales bacterium]